MCGLVFIVLVSRREVRELGMVVVIDARMAPPPPQFFKAMTNLQVRTQTQHEHTLEQSKVLSNWLTSR